MKCEEPMKNLWMVSGRESQALVTHSARLPSTAFVPICFMGQLVEANGESEVIPLPGLSY